MAKKTDQIRTFKGSSKKTTETTTASNSQTEDSTENPSTMSETPKSNHKIQLQYVSYMLFLYNFIHFTKEDRGFKGEGVLEDDVLKVCHTFSEDCYSLMIELGKDVKILTPKTSASDFSHERLIKLFGFLYSKLSVQPESPYDKKFGSFIKSISESIRRETIENMVKFLVNYKFNECEGVNQNVLFINDLLVCLGRLIPIINVQMVENGLISGWLVRILKENAENAIENIEIYRLFATQWIHVIVTEYQMFRRRAKEIAMKEKQTKIDIKRKEFDSKRAAKQKKLEKRKKELEDQLNQETNPRNKRSIEDELLHIGDDDDDDEERILNDIDELEKSDDSGSNDPIVRKIRKQLFDENFVKTACNILKSLPTYSDKDIIVIVSSDPNYNAEKKVTLEDHRLKCNALLYQELMQILKEMLTSTYAFDDDLFNKLSTSMVKQDLKSIFDFAFRDTQNVNTNRRAFNWLYFLLHNQNEEIRTQLAPHVYRIVEIFMSSIEEKNGKIIFKEETLSAACLFLIGYISGSSREISIEIHTKFPQFFESLIELFKDRSTVPSTVLSVIYGSITSLIRFALTDEEFLQLDQKFQFIDEVVSDVYTNDSLLRFPGIVMSRILLERLEHIPTAQAEPLYVKLLDSRIGDIMLQTIFDKRFTEEEGKGSQQNEVARVIQQRFMHPGSLTTLNILLDQASKTNNNEINKSLFEMINTDERYGEFIQFMKFMQRTKVKRFSYKYVFGLIGLIVVIVLLFPIVVRIFGKTPISA